MILTSAKSLTSLSNERGERLAKMYRVVFVYAPYPAKEFKHIEDAKKYRLEKVAESYIVKKTLFGWKKI